MTEPIAPEPVEQTKVEEIVPRQEAAREEIPVSDNSDAEMDEVLDRLLANDFPESTREPASPIASAPANDPDFDRALKALQRDGVPSDVIDSLRSDPSKVKEWGLKAAKRQADVDAFGAKVAESKKSDDKQVALDSPKSSAKTDDGEADADPLSEFGELFGEEAVKPLKAMHEKLRQEFEAKSKLMEIRHESQLAYSRIAAEYGRNAPDFSVISETAAAIGRDNPSKFDSVESIIREAFRRKAGEPKKIDPRNTARPTVGKTPARVSPQIDKEDIALDILLSGGSRDDVRRMMTR